jgi:hypothetical protein
VLAACGGGGERVLLPFRNVIADVDLALPAGTIGVGCGDGAVVGTSCFDPPVHPLGEVRSLSIEGHGIALAATALENGMLSTRDFGQFELQISRIDPTSAQVFDILVTERQIRQLESLVGQRAARAGTTDPDAPATASAPVYRVFFEGVYRGVAGDREVHLRFWEDGRAVAAWVAGPSDPHAVARGMAGGPGSGGSWNQWNRIELRADVSIDGKFYEYAGRIDPGGKTLQMGENDGQRQRYVEFTFVPLEGL